MTRVRRLAWLAAPALFAVTGMAFYDGGRTLAAPHWRWTATTARVVSRSEYIDVVPGQEGRQRRARLVVEYAPRGATRQVALLVEPGSPGATAAPGTELPVRYDPADPVSVIVEPPGRRGAIGRVALGGVALIMGAWLAWVAWRRRG